MSTTRTTFSYPPELKKKMEELATKNQRSLSNYIQIVLNDHLKEQGVDVSSAEVKSKKSVKKKRSRTKSN